MGIIQAIYSNIFIIGDQIDLCHTQKGRQCHPSYFMSSWT